ncbi:GON1 protein, partial [Origma solitaria]|nr:GON1 protein [Origma solitaria]
MESSGKLWATVLLCVLALGMCLGQHWSFGLQPGGKRSPQELLGPFQEIGNEMEKLGEARQSECPGSEQDPRLRELREAVVSDGGCVWGKMEI